MCKVLLESCKELRIPVKDMAYESPGRNGRSEEQYIGHHNVKDGDDIIVGYGGNKSLHSQTEDNKM